MTLPPGTEKRNRKIKRKGAKKDLNRMPKIAATNSSLKAENNFVVEIALFENYCYTSTRHYILDSQL